MKAIVLAAFLGGACHGDSSKAPPASADPPGYCMTDPGLGTETCYGAKADCIGELHPDEPVSLCRPVSELWMYTERFDSWKPEVPPVRNYYTTKSKCDSRMESDARGAHNAGTHATISECHHVP